MSNSTEKLTCNTCKRLFTNRVSLHRHIAHEHSGKLFKCEKCEKTFSRLDVLRRHQKIHDQRKFLFRCDICDKLFPRKDGLTRHNKVHRRHIALGKKLLAKKTDNKRQNANEDSQIESPAKKTRQTAPTEQCNMDNLFFPEQDPVIIGDHILPSDVDESVLTLYRENWPQIRTNYHVSKRIQDRYNFRLTGLAPDVLMNLIIQIFNQQKYVFKINYSFGCILRHIETGELKYYYSCCNNGRALPEPILIRNRSDLNSVLNTIEGRDFLQEAKQFRSSSKWVVDLIPNLTVYINKLKEHPIGAPICLPNFILNNQGLVSLLGDKNGCYNDSHCLFRCLALHLKGPSSLEKVTTHLLNIYAQHKEIDLCNFKGVCLSELDSIEKLFRVSIFVYELKLDNESGAVTAELVRRSHTQYEPLYLNLYEDHFSYIKNKELYSKSFSCPKCGQLWKHLGKLNRHMPTCEAKIRHVFPGGVYNTQPTIFEQLEEEGITVEETDRYFPFRATFDLEVYFEKCVNAGGNTQRLTWEDKHVPISISVCSNIPGYMKPVCFVSDGCSKTLVCKFLNYLKTLSTVSYELLLQKYAKVFADLDRLIAQPVAESNEFTNIKQKKFAKNLSDRFQRYLKELPVIGFNSGSYDLNVIKEYFFPALLQYEPIKFSIKRNNTTLCLQTNSLKFLDISNYLAPGCSYAQFLKAYGCTVAKGFFPYEWLTSVEKLSHPELVSHGAFYSSLKRANITSEEYSYCQEVWDRNRMKSMQDFLIWYNNNDVLPFLEALDKMTLFYTEKGIDMFKDGVSVPGLTLKYLFKNLGSTLFTLFNENNKDLYYTFKQNIVGGPSIIFHRYHEADKTYIREVEMKANGLSPKLCKKIVGFDANALYLWALMQPMPTDWFLRRRSETRFKREVYCPPGASRVSREWLDWEAYIHGIPIKHKFNDKETRVGSRRLPIDGFSKATNTVWQFHGCWYHQHEPCTRYKVSNDAALAIDRRKTTANNAAYIRSLGYTYNEIYECEWYALKKANPAIQQFVDQNIGFFMDHQPHLTQAQILEGVETGELFGVVECDIHVPEALKDYFAEMPPIFKHAEVSPSDAGSFMQQFAAEHGMTSKPRKSLIGSMFAVKILLATPLLKWYLEKGLVVSQVHQVIQFKPETCFENFGNDVSTARRAGDNNSEQSILAETMKLMGNSGYGRTVTNKLNQRDVHYCNENSASRKVNSFFFRSLEPISDNCYEILMSKKKIRLDLPLQIGFFVYQYAKLRMLQFYYDLILKYIDRVDFQYCAMDTDSAYIALSSDTLDDVVKPSMKHDYDLEKYKWFLRTDSDEHYAYDKRTPGLFKEEWTGTGIVALCSKTYYCYGDNGNKFSCKGVSRNHSDICKDRYLDVLVNKNVSSGINKGFRMHGNAMHTYLQYKDAFTYYYAKRKVLEDGVSTTFLDL